MTAERGTRRWVLQCVEHPGALSEVTRLDQAEEMMREAIAFVAGVPEDQIEIELRPQLPREALEHFEAARVARELAAEANSRAARESRLAAVTLHQAGLSTRDIGTVLGVSHQRAHQLVSSHLVAPGLPASLAPVRPWKSAGTLDRTASRSRGAHRSREVGSMAANRNVVPNPSGGWDVTGAGERSSGHFDTQSEAIDRAKEIVRNAGGGEVTIHGRDGQIRAKDTVDPGNDPRNIPG